MTVRTVIVPAIFHSLSDRASWPSTWLDRLLPKVDTAGAALAPPPPNPALIAAR